MHTNAIRISAIVIFLLGVAALTWPIPDLGFVPDLATGVVTDVIAESAADARESDPLEILSALLSAERPESLAA